MRERHVRLAPAPDIAPLIRATFSRRRRRRRSRMGFAALYHPFGNTFQPSFPAKAGNPVRCGLSVTTPASGILGHPPSRVTTGASRPSGSGPGCRSLIRGARPAI